MAVLIARVGLHRQVLPCGQEVLQCIDKQSCSQQHAAQPVRILKVYTSQANSADMRQSLM